MSEGRIFKNVSEVAVYLNKSGHPVSRSTVYNHKSWGWLRPDKGKGFSLAAVKKYIRERLEEGEAPVDEEVLSDKKNADAQKAVAQAKHWEIKTKLLEGKYVERELFERELAARAAIFKSDMENFIRARSPEIIAFVDGEASRSPDLIEYLLEHLETWLGRYAEEKEFSLPVG